MIKETADKHSSLAATLEHLKYTDGTFDAAGFSGILAVMTEDYAPRGHAIRAKARNTLFHKTFRKFKEKPRWFFRRVDKNLQTRTTPFEDDRNIILGAVTGRKSQEVGKYQHTFPSFPGDACRDDVDLWEKYWESVFWVPKGIKNARMISWR